MTGTADLFAALHADACGLRGLEAAIELLISHARWLRRDDFLHFVHTAPTRGGRAQSHRSTGRK